jgi:MYXO-CTERM domain-containing protein
MADFISLDITPAGEAQVTYANDSNQLGSPAALVKGVPVTTTARQLSGPRLIGSGDVSAPQFDTVTMPAGVIDATGDAHYPLITGPNIPQLDLIRSRVEWADGKLIVRLTTAGLANLTSPDTLVQQNTWWLTVWHFGTKIYFARVQSSAGGAPTCSAGPPGSFDRPGLTYYPVPTMVDYSGGTTVACNKLGNEWVVTVPASLVGNPKTGDLLEGIAGYSMIDSGAPLFVAPGPGNIPTVTDATPTYNLVLGSTTSGAAPSPTPAPTGGSTGGVPLPQSSTERAAPGVVFALLLLIGLGLGALRRRHRGSPPV